MQIRNKPDAYGAVAKLLHWSAVGLILLGWALGTVGDDLPRGTIRSAGFVVHVGAGLLILVLLALRLAWRVVDAPPPALPSPVAAWTNRAALYVHYALYALMLVVPLAGIVAQFLRGDALPVFGLFDIASPWATSRASARAAKEVHEVLANALLLLAALHAAAALFHHWILRDSTLQRMLPGRR